MLHSHWGKSRAPVARCTRVYPLATIRIRIYGVYIERCARLAEIRMHADWLCASGDSPRVIGWNRGRRRANLPPLHFACSRTRAPARESCDRLHTFAQRSAGESVFARKEWWRRFGQTLEVRKASGHVRKLLFLSAIFRFCCWLISQGNVIAVGISRRHCNGSTLINGLMEVAFSSRLVYRWSQSRIRFRPGYLISIFALYFTREISLMVLIAWNTGYGLKQKCSLCILKLCNFTDTITCRLRFNDTDWQLILDLSKRAVTTLI